MYLSFSDAGGVSTRTHFVSLMSAGNSCSHILCNQMSGLTKFEGEIPFLRSLCGVHCLLEFSADLVSMIGKMDPHFHVCVYPRPHTPNGNLWQWGQISETSVCDFEGHEWEWDSSGGSVNMNHAVFIIQRLNACPSPPASCATLEKPPHLSDPQFLNLEEASNHCFPPGLTVGLS